MGSYALFENNLNVLKNIIWIFG